MEGNWTALVGKVRIAIPPHAVLPFRAKDGRSHWCGRANEDGTFQTYCFTAGEIRS